MLLKKLIFDTCSKNFVGDFQKYCGNMQEIRWVFKNPKPEWDDGAKNQSKTKSGFCTNQNRFLMQYDSKFSMENKSKNKIVVRLLYG